MALRTNCVQIGSNEVSIKLAANGIPLRTTWDFKWVPMGLVSNEQQTEWHYAPTEFNLIKTMSVSDSHQKEWHYARAESWNWSKRGRYTMSSGWNSITHFLRVNVGYNELSIKLAQHWNGNTHFLRVEIGRNKASINLAADRMALWHYALAESEH